MKSLNGSELAGYIKERQARQVRGLRQHYKTAPRLAIVVANDSPVIDTYVRLKQAYAEDILVDVEIHRMAPDAVANKIDELNADDSVKGVILQLPLSQPSLTDELVKLIAPEKDVDSMGEDSPFDPATAMAINWLLTGYNIALENRKIVIIGRGRLVGAPLARMWRDSGLNVTVLGRGDDLSAELPGAEIIVSATGVPGLLTSELVPIGATVVDAGTADDGGRVVGDAAPELYQRDDLTITPVRGGVGPLTIAALMDNVILATRNSIG
ncbi:MAG: bifunctional 5,10-methylenetetrahydrofolate dehydrogenase/5,10-methenyltetrahydrofolate cyclohydrolase [Candidatus Nomurabacteria bacterium]|jgi:methylenetetrahydrofolate dehydrogenase (NADP+)/methenyltetrahydrofolate cyclohydrolase|nr:bifunctional 5,10-methylenetetrahydrofolate dehydrogenase/5,10-methenyltetrahydrofolate cyclohydrolase [Candidatus Nomurabacteria bacterium]